MHNLSIRNNLKYLRSPTSGTPYDLFDAALHADSKRIKIVSGIPDFLDESPVERNQDNLQIDYEISAKPWRSNLDRTYGSIISHIEVNAISNHRDLIGKRISLLDIGCGASKFSNENILFRSILETTEYYAGVEPSWEMLKEATRDESPLFKLQDFTLVRAVGEALPFGNDSFDLITIKSTLDHCFDPNLVMRECYRVLKPGGLVVITLQNFKSWQRRVISTLMPRQYRKHRARDHHTSLFWPAKLRSDLTENGFSSIEIFGFKYLGLSRYKLAILEDILTYPLRKLMSKDGYHRLLKNFDGFMFAVAPNYCGIFIATAYKE